jgi:hypothetical protein
MITLKFPLTNNVSQFRFGNQRIKIFEMELQVWNIMLSQVKYRNKNTLTSKRKRINFK